MTWSAAQYTKFEDERTRPVRDLIAGIPNPQARTAVDIGCGPGNSTELLAARFPGAAVSGVDNAPDMIAAAKKRLPALTFLQSDITAWAATPGAFDVILSNAALQWVPDHESLFPALMGKLADGGTLAVQVPDNAEEAAHTAMRDIAANGPWSAKFGSAVRLHRPGPLWYYGALRERATRLDIWRTTYFHVLKGGPGAIVEWFRGSGLRPYLDALEGAERADFLARYEELVAAAYPAFPDGTVLLPMPRLFIIATR
jgi:trans-aconitate 2-methyltransferase